MNKLSKRILFWTIAVFAIFIGLYPISFLLPNLSPDFLKGKGALAQDLIWMIAFKFHIIGGGIALLIGWLQFWKKFRINNIKAHRIIGSIYLISILGFGATGGFYIAVKAMGGFPAQVGFSFLAILWFISTLKAFLFIRSGNIESHKNWMIRSYALTLAAVTLRILLPIFLAVLHLDFEPAYIAISWLCWVPNLIIGEIIVNNKWVSA